jgi:hypothetical protein
MRDSGPWTYAIVNLAHVLGLSTLFGSILVLDLRLIGVGRRVPLAAVSSAVVPIAATGFVVAATTGAGLLATKATEYVGNPFLLIKFPAIALGVINAVFVRGTSAWRAHQLRDLTDPEKRQLAVLGGVSLLCWLTAITAGRMIAYW